MRKLFQRQLTLTTISLHELIGRLNTRDDIDKLVIAFHNIFNIPALRYAITEKLSALLTLSHSKGREGMDYWKLFVFGTLRVSLNMDYDRLQNLANNHRSLRLVLGHGDLDHHQQYGLTTLKENVGLLTEEVLKEINVLIVQHGQRIIHPYSQNKTLTCRADSYVAKTNVHFPTDISLLYDALRQMISMLGEFSKAHCISGFRQFKANCRKLKKRMQAAARSRKRSDHEKQKMHKQYIEFAAQLLKEVSLHYNKIKAYDVLFMQEKRLMKLQNYAQTFIDQIDKRVLQEHSIRHEEKIFSINEPHTEWINKGKAGVPVELGVKLAIVQDKHQFILHHHVMEHQQDAHVAVDLAESVKTQYGVIDAMSFDRGFWSPENQRVLEKEIRKLVLPKKGYKNQSRQAIENEKEFKKLRKEHSAVESGIHALQHHGVDVVPDKGIENYKRYIALGVLGYNLHLLGNILLKKEYRRKRKRAA